MSNSISIMGTIGRDIDAMRFESGLTVAEFSIAVNRKVKGEDVTDWWNIKAFNKTAEIIAQYFEKGQRILVFGELTQDHWIDKSSGEKRSKPVIVVNTFSFIERRDSGNGRSGQGYTTTQTPASNPVLEDVPF